MANNYNDISHYPIDNAELPRLNLYISVLGYLEGEDVCFKTVEINDNKTNEENKDDEVAVIVSNLEEEKNK